MKQVDYLIIGAGLTGLGAAYRLKQYDITSFVVLDSADRVGGLAKSFQDDAGFNWDLGGHVLFSRDKRFIRCIDDAMGDDLLGHQRRAKVNVAGQWTGYPFQDHIHQLSPKLSALCQEGLFNAPGPNGQTHSFRDWIYHAFGDGICRLFMEPYNQKIWTVPLEKMGFYWVNDRVSVSPHNLSVPKQSDQITWGPNSDFRYPRNGGIGAIAAKLNRKFPSQIRLHHEVSEINLLEKVATVVGGTSYRYNALLSTIPLDNLIKKIIRPPQIDLLGAADRLRHNCVAVVGIGLDMVCDRQTSWMYFPGQECPFYRLTNLHNYSPTNTPKGKNQTALMAEVAFSPGQSEDESALISTVIDGLFTTGIIDRADEEKIISTWSIKIPYAYPIPTLDRDQALAVIHPYLENHSIFSRGRFGGWKYEVGNMDHSFMQGFEWAERMIAGRKERIYSIFA